MEKNVRIYIAGHRGLVGSAILRNLQARGYANFVLRTHAELELERQADVEAFFARAAPRSPPGAPAPPAANSCTPTTWPTPAYF
jgi:nucleoside-diphosphate-sugar epimerase